jgi:hypothetical protein
MKLNNIEELHKRNISRGMAEGRFVPCQVIEKSHVNCEINYDVLKKYLHDEKITLGPEIENKFKFFMCIKQIDSEKNIYLRFNNSDKEVKK